jgi:hypothetical protein
VDCDFGHCARGGNECGSGEFATANDGEGGVRVEEGVAEDVLGEVVDAFGGYGVGGPFGDEDGEPGGVWVGNVGMWRGRGGVAYMCGTT